MARLPRFARLAVLGLAVVAGTGPGASAQRNVLILLADDLGVDNLAAYGEGSAPPPTPNIDLLAQQGVLFRNVWSNPSCSPTRATLMTGRYALRTGIGYIVFADDPSVQSLPQAEITLPEMLDLGTGGAYAHAYFGKWHLSNATDAWPLSPNLHGWAHFDGTEANLIGDDDYFEWTRVVDGVVSTSNVYATTATVDAALAWIGQQSGPWLAYVAFHAPHDPFHAPPATLHTQDLSGAGPPGADPLPYFRAMTEALDTEIGRLLSGIGPQLANTLVIFLGDNGSATATVLPPFDPTKAKASLYEGGVNVPLIVAGPGVRLPGSECQALVNTTDLFATVMAIAGVEPGALPAGVPGSDSVSFLPYLEDSAYPSVRKLAYTEYFVPNGTGPYEERIQAVRGPVFKLIRRQGGADELFDLVSDPFEGNDLLLSPPLGEAATSAKRAMQIFLRNL